MSRTVTIRVTPAQAKILWATVDGALDAGACKDGLTARESKALTRVVGQILSQITLHKIDANDDVDMAEAASDLLKAFDHDYRTVGYKHDLWECLRETLSEGGAR